MAAHATQSTFPPVIAQFSSADFLLGAGVAIFHIASQRVVVCRASDRHGQKFYFLPKGRRDAGEESGRGAEREGYEESGYRNRLLPLPTKHRQPQAHPRVTASQLTAEPVWTQLFPLYPTGHPPKQYILFWYIAETLPPDLEKELETKAGEAYRPPPPFPPDLTLHNRIKMEPDGYEPIHHEGTGVDEEERAYESFLLPVNEAVEKLGKRAVMADVVLKGWAAIQQRLMAEDPMHEANTEKRS